MSYAIAVTGTDTGVGKTLVACAIAAESASRGLRVRVFKPVETGVVDPHGPRDAHLLRAAARSDQPLEQISAFTFRDPLAPMAAAQLAGISVDPRALDEGYALAAGGADLTVVEGAGGLLVPISRTESFASLFARWQLPVVVVAPNRLGVLNHVLLTVGAARSARLHVAAVVLHERPAADVDSSVATNETILAELLPLVPIVRFPWVDSVEDHTAIAHAARTCGLTPSRLLDASSSS